jgi:hypothetical protein
MTDDEFGLFCVAANEFATQVKANGEYILQELSQVDLPNGLLPQLQGVCQNLKDAYRSIVGVFGVLLVYGDDAEMSPDEVVDRIVAIAAPIPSQLDAVVQSLMAAAQKNPAFTAAHILVAESAVNVINAWVNLDAAAKV